jgi:hypothetical protein
VHEMAVRDGALERDAARGLTKFAIVDRYHGDAKVASMFWLGYGPRAERVAVACSVGMTAQHLGGGVLRCGHGDGGEPAEGDRWRLCSGA